MFFQKLLDKSFVPVDAQVLILPGGVIKFVAVGLCGKKTHTQKSDHTIAYN